MKHKIGIIGFGAIAKDVVNELIDTERFVISVFVRSSNVCLPNGVTPFNNIDDLLRWRPDLIIEAAGQSAVTEYIPTCLEHAISVVISSVGSLSNNKFYTDIKEIASNKKAKILIPSGAIAALDYINAATIGKYTEVNYESRKPINAWRDELTNLGYLEGNIDEEVVLFEGDASTAARKYPQNLNVAATLALAGAGMENTKVRVVADPNTNTNKHLIQVSGPNGTLNVSVVNKPSATNPKTSAIVSKSIVASVNQHFSTVQFL